METATRSSKGRTALTVAGATLLLLGAAVIAAGGAALWQTGKSDGGYISSGVHRFDTSSHAIVTEGLKVDSDVPRWLIGRTRITATSSNGKPVFVGVARERDVDAYLANVSRSQIRNLEYSPFTVEYANRAGTASPARPASRSIWAASTSGTGDRQLTWRLRSGEWRVVLMNADGSSGVTARAVQRQATSIPVGRRVVRPQLQVDGVEEQVDEVVLVHPSAAPGACRRRSG